MRTRLPVLLLLTGVVAPAPAQSSSDGRALLQSAMGFTAGDLAALDRGEAVAKLLSPSTPKEVFVIGAVHIRADPARYREFALDIERLRKNEQYLDLGPIHAPAKLSDFDRFQIRDDELADLRKCKAGNCNFQAPAEAIEAFQQSIDWSSPQARQMAEKKLRELALAAVTRYQTQGTRALGSYNDKGSPLDVAAQFEALVGAVKGLPHYLPELNRHLLEYPAYELPGAKTLFHWEYVKFGLKPTLRINHTTAHRHQDMEVVAIKQIYASHYFQVALDLSICLPDGKGGFYLVNWRGSRQDGLTGARGSLLRRVVTGKVRSAQAEVLAYAKRSLEEKEGSR